MARPVWSEAIVDVIAPAGPFDEPAFHTSIDTLRANGFRPRFRPDIFSRQRFLAGSDARRLEELHSAIDAPDSDVIWCARGGYGATRLLPFLTLERIATANKLLVGFSDITALHARWLAAGVSSVHGSMIVRFGTEPADVTERLLMLLRTGKPPALLTGRTLVAGRGEGVLTGGNLAVLAAMCGTPFQPDLRGKIVFLEDVGERPYRLDRLLVQCRQAGLLGGIAGVAIGEMVDCEQQDGAATSREVMEEHVCALGVPAIRDLPCGHGAINQALPFGVRARVDGNAGTLEFVEPIHGG